MLTQTAFLISIATVVWAQLIDPTATTIDNFGSGSALSSLTGSGGGALAAPTTLLSPASGYGGGVLGATNSPYYSGSGYGSNMYSPYAATSTPYSSGYGSSATYSPYYGGAYGGYGTQMTPYMCCSVQHMPSNYSPYTPYASNSGYSPYATSSYYGTNNNYQPQQQQLPYTGLTSSPSYVSAQPYESGLTTTGYASQPLHPYFCIPICGGSQQQSYGGYGSGYGSPTSYSGGYGYGAQSGSGNGYSSSYGFSTSPYGSKTGAYGSPYSSVYGSPNSYYSNSGYGGGLYNNNNNYYGSGAGGFSPLSSDFGSGGFSSEFGSRYGGFGGFPRRATTATAANTRALKSGVKAASTTASRNSRIVTKS